MLVGGGSGHYPAFAGYVGPGFADAAAMGDVFASPSTRHVHDVCRVAERGGGVLMTFGNYAGDVLNFGLAAERLRRDGVEVEIVAVTDDLASAPADQLDQRRGIAGTLMVTKVASAAAEAGHDLASVADLARRTNARTRTLGVAFGGCTLPGADEPLFDVPEGRMATGLGVHGEPGIDEVDLPSAGDLAELLVSSVLEDAPSDAGDRVAVLLNGLGSTKHEELFVLWGTVAPLLREAGLDLIAPVVGELITSLDMAGVSLSLSWLDEETEPLWTADGQCPALQRGERIKTTPAPEPDLTRIAAEATGAPTSGEASRVAAATVRDLAKAVAEALSDAEQELGRLDAVAGDGDHGRGMARGSAAAVEAADRAVETGAGSATTLSAAADGWADEAGGTSGALWGVGLQRWSAELSDTDAPDLPACARGARAALEGISSLGGAQIGDKTLLDALAPLVEALEERPRPRCRRRRPAPVPQRRHPGGRAECRPRRPARTGAYARRAQQGPRRSRRGLTGPVRPHGRDGAGRAVSGGPGADGRNGPGSAARGLQGVLDQWPSRVLGVVEPALGQGDGATRRRLPPPRSAQLEHRERLGRVEPREQLLELGERGHERQRVAQRPARSEALEIPRDVLAELLAATLLPHVQAQQLGVAVHRRRHLAQAGQRGDLLAGEGCGEVAEQPRPAQAAASDHDAGGAGLLDHPHRVVASHTSPLPSTGISTCSTSSRMQSQSACPE